jgi:hypothetical protein
LYPVAAVLSFAPPHFLLLTASKILQDQDSVLLIYTNKQELKGHLMAAKEGIFLFRYSVKAQVLLVECGVKVAIPFEDVYGFSINYSYLGQIYV